MKFRPLHDRVLLRRSVAEAKTAGGILLPEMAQEKSTQAEVVAVGSGTHNEAGKLIALDVQVGDLVLISKWGGNEITIDGEELLIVKESDIMGIVEGGTTAKAA